MKKGVWRSAFGVAAFLGAMFCSSQQAFTAPAGLNIIVSPLLPDNQRTDGVNYYDLLLEKGESQTVTLVIENPTDQDRTIAIEVNPATTNHNGMVEYIPADPDEDMVPFDIREAVEVEKEIEVKAESSVDVPIKINMPDVSYDGVVAGGLKVKEVTEASEEPTEETTTDSSLDDDVRRSSIKNTYNYVVALLLSENETAVAPEITLGSMALRNINSQDAIGIELKNTENTYVRNVRVEAKVSLEGSDVSFSSEQSNKQIAPASTYVYPVPVDSDLPAGDYLVDVVVYSEEAEDGAYEASDGKKYNYRWALDQVFTLEEKIIQGNNDVNAFAPKANRWLYVAAFIGLTGTFAGIAFYLQQKKLRTRVRRQ